MSLLQFSGVLNDQSRGGDSCDFLSHCKNDGRQFSPDAAAAEEIDRLNSSGASFKVSGADDSLYLFSYSHPALPIMSADNASVLSRPAAK